MIDLYTFIVNQSQLRLDQYLVGKLPELSRSKIQKYIKLGQVTVNGESVKSSLILQSLTELRRKFWFGHVMTEEKVK